MEDREAVYFDLSSEGEVFDLQPPKSPTAIERAIHGEGSFGSALDEAAIWTSKNLKGLAEPGLQFHIAPRLDEDLLYGHDLSLYASALVDRVKSVSGTQFSCVKIAKGHTSPMALYVASSVRTSAPTDWVTATFTTRKSYAKPDFARAVYESTQLIRSEAARPGPLRVKISYLTGLPRTWSRLWQPTVLGLFSGAPTSERPLHSFTSRIVELEFDHRSVGASLEHHVQIAVSIASAVRED